MQSPSDPPAAHRVSEEKTNFFWERSLNGYSLQFALINGEEGAKIQLQGQRFGWLSIAELDFLWRRSPGRSGQVVAEQSGAAFPNESTEDQELRSLLEDTELMMAIHHLGSW